MPNPISVLRTLRPELAAFEKIDLEMNRRGYVGTRILPAFSVSIASGTFGVISIESLLAAANIDTRRTSTGGYNRGTYTFDERSYITKENGWEEPVDERESNMYGNFFNLEEVAAARAWEHVLSQMEKRIIAATVGATVTAGRTNAAAALWTLPLTATPITDVAVAQEAIWLRTGIWPNLVTMSRRAYRAARVSKQVVDAIQASGAGVSATQREVTAQQLANVFDVDEVLVSDAVRNTANAGQTAVLDTVFPNTQVLVSVAATTNDFKEPSLGRVFNWAGDGSQIQGDGAVGVVESYEEPQTRKHVIRVRHETAEYILYPEAGQVITGVMP